MERSDKDFTEEDREVCEINRVIQRSDFFCVYFGEYVILQVEDNFVFEDFNVFMCLNVVIQIFFYCESTD